MPITVFDIKGVPGSRRVRIEAAVVAFGRNARGPHASWIDADPFKGGLRVPDHGSGGIRAHRGIRDGRWPSRDRGAGARDPRRV